MKRKQQCSSALVVRIEYEIVADVVVDERVEVREAALLGLGSAQRDEVVPSAAYRQVIDASVLLDTQRTDCVRVRGWTHDECAALCRAQEFLCYFTIDIAIGIILAASCASRMLVVAVGGVSVLAI